MKTSVVDIINLINQRYICIADYPFSTHKVGDIAECRNEKQAMILYSQYPHLYRKLAWYEYRIESEMPKYLKFDANRDGNYNYYEIESWNMKTMDGIRKDDPTFVCGLRLFNDDYTYKPCTESEYQYFQKNKNE